MGGLLGGGGSKAPPPPQVQPVVDQAAAQAAADAAAKAETLRVSEADSRRRAGAASNILFGNTDDANSTSSNMQATATKLGQ